MVHGKNENVPELTKCVLCFDWDFISAMSFDPFCTLHTVFFILFLTFFLFNFMCVKPLDCV